MRGLNLFASREIGDCPRQLQDAVLGSRREVHLAHRRPHQALTFILQLAKLTYLPHSHIGVTDNIGLRIGKPLLLNVSCGLHARADGFA